MRDHSRRWAWLGVLVIGLVLYVLVLRTLVRTQNPNFVPALILLGATVVPLAFLTFAQARTGRWQVPAWALVTSAFFGGVIGTVVAGTLEYDTLRRLGALPMLFHGAQRIPAPRIAFALHHGRDPEGRITRACGVDGCVAGPCLLDQPMRQARQRADRLFERIFGEAS